jgi:hypothetical protein
MVITSRQVETLCLPLAFIEQAELNGIRDR